MTLLTLTAVALVQPAAKLPIIELKPKMMITKSCRVKPGIYRIGSKSETGTDSGIYITGSGITVDFTGSVLEGSPQTITPNGRQGTGIMVEGQNVTIKGAKVRGYKVGLHGRGAKGIRILNSDFSYNWKQQLLSNQEREDTADWMSYHRNEKNEWLRYGAAIYLRDCDRFEVRDTKVHGGQNALMLMECDKGVVWNNDFSFNSSLGLGMYKSSDNRVMHNKMDWNVRGFSFGVYNRGQDSAGILIYEQSHRNLFAYNSVTHSGDGFFLWAGQTTMDTGKGGCNDNILYGNDWSHAPTNGIEATFSRNVFAHNLILECWHGIWGGYSYETKIIGNVFGHNTEAIAIEHGQDNLIQGNVFNRDNDGIYLWFNDRPQDPNWGYPKYRDTRSRDYTIQGNVFQDVRANALRINNSLAVNVVSNDFRASGNLLLATGKNESMFLGGNSVTGTGKGIALPEGTAPGQNRVITSGPDAREPLPAASALSQGDVSNRSAYLKRFETTWNPFQDWRRTVTTATGPASVASTLAVYRPTPLANGQNPFLKKGALRGWLYMLVDQWGPYDFKRPILWPRQKESETVQVFELLGPKGVATPRLQEGAEIIGVSSTGETWSVVNGNNFNAPVPGFVKVRFGGATSIEQAIVMEFKGDPVIDFRGIYTPKGQPFTFAWVKTFIPIDWTLNWFEYEDAQEPRSKYDAFKALISGTPKVQQKVNELNMSWNPRGIRADKYGLNGLGEFTVPTGNYELRVTSDDGVKVWVDDKQVIDNWNWHGPTLDTAQLKLGGKHKIRIEYFEIDGYATLKVELVPKR